MLRVSRHPGVSILVLMGLGVLADACLAAEPAAQTQPDAAFDIWEYRVLGNSVLASSELEQVLYPLLGPNKTLTDVEQARASVERIYKDRGYGTVFVDIPEQSVEEGIVRLQVTEATINRVQVTGTRYFSNREIRAALPAAEPGVVPHLPTVQEQITALNRETPDRSVVPVLRAGPRPGTVDMRLQVTDELPLHASLEVNNQYTNSTSKLRAVGSVNYDNLFARLDSLSLQYQTSPQEPSEVAVWAASYTLRLPDDRSKLALFYINSDSDVATVGDAGATIDVLGRGQIFGARYINPFHTSAAATHVFLGSVEYKDFEENVFATNFLRTPISYLNLSLGHMSAWRGTGQQVTLATTMNFGVRDMANSTEEFRVKRAHGTPNYWLMRLDSSYVRSLPWNFSLRLRTTGQYAVEPIISNEQFSVAGADGARGYLEAEQLGDIGVKASAELALPPLRLFQERVSIGPFMFYDFGRMTRLEPLRDDLGDEDPTTFGGFIEEPDRTLRSAGAGLEFGAFDMFSGAIVWAYPFVDGSDDGTRASDGRIHFVIRAAW